MSLKQKVTIHVISTNETWKAFLLKGEIWAAERILNKKQTTEGIVLTLPPQKGVFESWIIRTSEQLPWALLVQDLLKSSKRLVLYDAKTFAHHALWPIVPSFVQDIQLKRYVLQGPQPPLQNWKASPPDQSEILGGEALANNELEAIHKTIVFGRPNG